LVFIKDVGDKPSPKHSLDRINNDGPYRPDNVKWSTKMEQYRNRRGNHFITLGGESLIIADWAKRLGVSGACIYNRMKRGFSPEIAITMPSKR